METEDLAEKRGLKLLGQIPLVQGICDSGDAGTPIALKDDDIIAQAFENVAKSSIFAELIRE